LEIVFCDRKAYRHFYIKHKSYYRYQWTQGNVTHTHTHTHTHTYIYIYIYIYIYK